MGYCHKLETVSSLGVFAVKSNTTTRFHLLVCKLVLLFLLLSLQSSNQRFTASQFAKQLAKWRRERLSEEKVAKWTSEIWEVKLRTCEIFACDAETLLRSGNYCEINIIRKFKHWCDYWVNNLTGDFPV